MNRYPSSIVIMGVAGCGKSSLGVAVAQQIGFGLIEGDDHHSLESLSKMRQGIALTDADRDGWLSALGNALQNHPGGLVLTCSALKRSYRDQLRAACPGLRFIHLHGTAEQLRDRLQSRSGHYMPASLLDSQLTTLQAPGAGEQALAFNIVLPAAQIAAAAARQLTQTTSA